MRTHFLLLSIFILICNFITGQNIAITDDENYSPNSSAMLDVMSTTKGMLVPRLTSSQRNIISNPEKGLLVFDTDETSFYFYNGLEWINLTHGNASQIWNKSGNNIYLTSNTNKVGVNKSDPISALEVKASASSLVSDPLFQVINKFGDTVFAVYSDGVIVSFDESLKGNIGGFAVSGRTSSKASFSDYLRVTPDSTRVWVKKGVKGNIGGFAVSGRTSSKGTDEPILVTTFDSTRIYVDQQAKGNIGGFAVSGRTSSKGTVTPFMDMTTDNYFIGHQSGINNSGLYNLFLGYQTGQSTNSGNNNVFIGYQAGYSNKSGYNNIFSGFKAGYSNDAGASNVFIGDSAGYYNTSGNYNVSIGSQAGKSLSIADYNTIIGYKAGYKTNSGGFNTFYGHNAGYSNTNGVNQSFYGYNSGYENTGKNNTYLGSEAGYYSGSGSDNVYIGLGAGRNGTGSNNVFIGTYAGYHETGSNKLYIEYDWNTDPLIYGEFDNNVVKIHGRLGANVLPIYQLHSVDTSANSDAPAVYGSHNITDNWGIGVHGEGRYIGSRGTAINNSSGSAYGVYGSGSASGSASSYGIYGISSNSGTGYNYAGYFEGDVHVNGTLSKNAGSFKIDHPLDPENKYLVHSFVESPDMMNIYNGVVKLDPEGKAVVVLPEYFQELNKDFRYQLTAIGAPGPNLFIEKKISNNQFSIAGGKPGMEVSWEITGVRKDPYANANRIVVEQDKNEKDKGKYLNPELFGKTNDFLIHKSSK